MVFSLCEVLKHDFPLKLKLECWNNRNFHIEAVEVRDEKIIY